MNRVKKKKFSFIQTLWQHKQTYSIIYNGGIFLEMLTEKAKLNRVFEDYLTNDAHKIYYKNYSN